MKKIFMPLLIMTIIISCAPPSQLVNEGELFKNLTQITFNEKPDFDSVISSKNEMLFVSNRDGNSNIYLKKNLNT